MLFVVIDGCQSAYKLSEWTEKTLVIANVDYRRCSISIYTDILLVYWQAVLLCLCYLELPDVRVWKSEQLKRHIVKSCPDFFQGVCTPLP